MADKFSMDDYVDVAERIQDFKDTHRDGSLQILRWETTTVADKTFIVCECAAYRTPDDERPGHGIAWEPFPGATPYTKNSELMNAHTAAMGRAIIALGLTANRKLASRQEVRARVEEQQASKAPPMDKPKPAKKPPIVKRTEAEVTELRELAKAAELGWQGLALLLVQAGALADKEGDITREEVGTAVVRLTPEQLATVKGALEDEVSRKAAA